MVNYGLIRIQLLYINNGYVWLLIYPVVRREPRSYGYSNSLLNGELRSYQELPNHILVMVTIIYNQLFFIPEVTRIHEPDPCFILFHPISGDITHVHLTGLF